MNGNLSEKKISRVLDVGCGENKTEGSVGVDKLALPGVDVVHDLNKFPWPFEQSFFSRIILKHAISHMDDVPRVMEEIHRICSPNAIVEIIAPHFTSDNFFTDPTHRAHFGIRSMNYFCKNIENWKYQYIKNLFILENAYICFGEVNVDFNSLEHRRVFNPMKIIGLEFVANRYPRFYEKFLSNVISANTVYFKLRVDK